VAVASFEGWQWWQARTAEGDDPLQRAVQELRSQQTALGRRVDAQREAIDSLTELELESTLRQLETRYGQSESVSGAHRERLESTEESLAEQEARLVAVESGLAALAVRGESPTRRLELEEVDYLLRTANERLQLFGDLASAERALELADAQLQAIDDPLYLPVRRAIAAARLSLEAVPRPDFVALNETLAAVQARIPALPFEGEVATGPEAPDAAQPGDAEPGLWQRFKATLAGLVTVRRRGAEEELISIEDKDYLRQGLWLQLETARLALMRRDEALYGEALQRAGDTLTGHFAADSAPVVALREQLADLRAVPLGAEYPDISAPWARLQRLRASPPEAPAEPAPVPRAPADTAETDETAPPADEDGAE
jgi:uroporphyrin-3 C-methyltransferase